jgi:methyl-accepting chemotaxis protein
MISSLSNIPIARRLLLAFALAALVPSIILGILGFSLVLRFGSSQAGIIIVETMIAILCTLLCVISIGYVVTVSITTPLNQLATLTRRIARGETDARADITGHDEISLIGNSMNYMLDNIVRLIQETQSQRDVLQGQVEKLVSEVSGVGEGDLRVQAEVTADALGVLADSFNYMVEELSGLVVRVKIVAREVDSSTNMILDRMTQLVQTGEMQQRQMHQASTEVEHMVNSNYQVADRSQALLGVARGARRDAQGGRESVQQAVEGMGRINTNVETTAEKVQLLGERSREIDEIVTVIGGIAHQTNRLALDAAIQAAMAGENGKGFGAVAVDIRRLAERSKEQAASIAKIVRSVREEIASVAVSMQDTQRETQVGTQLTQEAGTALESIFSAVEQQAREIETISSVTAQQQQSSNAVVQIIQAVSEFTQQNDANTHEASLNMERLTRLVQQLRASVEAFKLRDGQEYFAPTPNSNIGISTNSTMNDEDSEFTVSSVFRAVSGTTQSPSSSPLSQQGLVQNALPSTRSTDPYSLYPITPDMR